VDNSDSNNFEDFNKDLLLEMERYIEDIWSFLPVPIIYVAISGLILDIDKAMSNFLKYSRNEIVGKDFESLFYNKNDGKEIFRLTMENNSVINKEYLLIDKENNEIPTVIHSLLRKDEMGNVLGFFLAFIDLTETKLQEKEKKMLYDKFIQLEKMSAVSQLAAGVAHEMNNPLGVILGFAQSVLKRIKDDDPLVMSIKSIEREANRCKEIVKKLLAFSMISKTQTRTIDIKITIEEVLALMKTQCRIKNIEIIREYEDNLPQVVIDRNQFQQIIVNLCENAIDAMPNGGKMTIKTISTPPISSPISGEDKGGVIISVKDTGVGMTDEVKQHIFEPFFSTKEVGKGIGLGLSLCYEVIKKYNGEIDIESEVGKGTTFIMKLPVGSHKVS
jgi:PAS domain S-box-containing protein